MSYALVIADEAGEDLNNLIESLPAARRADATDAVDDAKQAEQIAVNRYKEGLVGYLDVVFAETTLLSNERVATQIRGQRMVATVVLVKALGGGWRGVSAPPQLKPNSQPGETATNSAK